MKEGEMRIARGIGAAAVVAVAIIAASAAGAGSGGAWAAAAFQQDQGLEIVLLSSRPEFVTGGDAVVRVEVPAGVSLTAVSVTLNGADVTGTLRQDPASHSLVGLVAGLGEGANQLKAFTKQTKPSLNAQLHLRNQPAYGPTFSGPHQQPWVCETAASGLGDPPASGPCVAPTRYDWFYRTTAGQFAPYDPTNPPANLAQTTTIDGATVNYIVRVESGTIDESIYRIAIIDDPAQPTSNPWSAAGTQPGAGWNGKLTWPFGGGCSPGYRSGSNSTTSALQNTPLSLGFAVAFGTRNTLGTGCNDIVSAETVAMIKERFIEQYGLPKFTIGSGGSGGAMQQRLIVQNYPGLLDAITTGISYPDLVSILPGVVDCSLLNRYFDTIANPADWPASRRAKVDGYSLNAAGTNTTCRTWNGFARIWQTPFNGFSSVVPPSVRYDPVTNPSGARGSWWDGVINAVGRDPVTGFARSGYDNVGLQYGLNALNRGAITVDEFLDLNEKVGGLDVDGNFVPNRSVGDLVAISNVYRTGRLTSGEGQVVPTIDTRGYTDQLADIHTRERTFAMLDRLKRANGTTANQVNWMTPFSGAAGVNLAELALRAHNEWLDDILADTSTDPYAAKVIRNKPASLKDTCWEADGTAHEEPFTLDPSAVCNQLFPIHSSVRVEAGSPLAEDIMKCQTRPIDFSSYGVTFTDAQKQRLNAIFRDGVCDWSRPGVMQKPIKGTWLDFGRDGTSAGG
jgi:Tannase-like family of unknown function (DUF6351)